LRRFSRRAMPPSIIPSILPPMEGAFAVSIRDTKVSLILTELNTLQSFLLSSPPPRQSGRM
jgi:hypothetical protein